MIRDPSNIESRRNECFLITDVSEADTANREISEQWHTLSVAEQIKYERRVVRKLDLTLIPLLTLLYFLSFLDRANIGNAKIQGVGDPFYSI
jgi:hypothetical protein